jgi:signal transduction histidine kinase
MNQLWVRLSLYFGSIILLGVLVLVVAARLLVNDTVRQSFIPEQLQAPGGIVDTLAQYYQRHGSWTGVDNLMEGAHSTFTVWSGGMELQVLDRSGLPVYEYNQRPGNAPSGSGPMNGGPMGNGMGRHRTPIEVPIVVNDQTVGYLAARFMMVTPPVNSSQDIFQQLSRYLLLVALGAAVLGAIFSVTASRMITAPLTELAGAARAIGAGNLQQRVAIHGTDEVGEVATAFNEMAGQLQEAETLRRNLMADVAHELRTPLSVLQGNLRAMIDDVYPLNKEEVTRLYTQTRLLSRLVNDLHELAQAEAGQLSLNLATTDLRPLLRETIEIFAPMAEDAEIRLQAEIPPTLPAAVVDSVRLRQVLHNLLANALRHTAGGGAVTVTSSATADTVAIAIRDTGEGIATDHLPHVFDRFYRTDRARARDTGGAGLGLAIVRAIVQAHSGNVTVASAGLGQGSTFTVTLPVAGAQSRPTPAPV